MVLERLESKTYLHKGLPPGPITAPAKAALEAAVSQVPVVVTMVSAPVANASGYRVFWSASRASCSRPRPPAAPIPSHLHGSGGAPRAIAVILCEPHDLRLQEGRAGPLSRL